MPVTLEGKTVQIEVEVFDTPLDYNLLLGRSWVDSMHGYIIVAVDYFTKWAEAMLTFDNTGKTAALFLFNHGITRFGVPQAIITDHGSHFSK